MMDEIFASKHRDTNSVATIEDRCYVLTFNEYCRYVNLLNQWCSVSGIDFSKCALVTVYNFSMDSTGTVNVSNN